MSDPHKGLANQNIVILRRLSNVVAITIPYHILEELGWHDGNMVRLTVSEGKLIVQKGELVFQ